MTDLEKLKDPLKAATSGPWFVRDSRVCGRVSVAKCVANSEDYEPADLCIEEDAVLIAEAVNTLPDLIAELEQLRAAGPVLDREVIRLAVIDAMAIAEACGKGQCSADDWHSEYNRAIDAILASAMTREQVEREVIERLIAEAGDMGVADLSGPDVQAQMMPLADWLRSQI